MKHQSDIDSKSLQEVIRVTDFARKHKLKSDEQIRLIRLLGSFATRQELMMNARLESKTR
jgi:hypothetical protein